MTGVVPDPVPEPSAGAPVQPRRLLVRFILGIIAIMAVLGAVGFLFHETVVSWARGFVAIFGGWGVFGGFAIADAFPVPIPHDVVSAAGLVGGLGCEGNAPCGWRGYWTVVAWATAGSYIGSVVGFAIGRTMSHTALFARVMRRRGKAAHQLAERYGVRTLVIGALTPLNYCIVVWTAGALGMRWRDLLLVSLLRAPRVMFYLWLFKVGLIDPMY